MSKALELIVKCLSNNEPILDLGYCALTNSDLYQDSEAGLLLKKCTHITTLILSNTWRDWNEDEKTVLHANMGYRSTAISPFITDNPRQPPSAQEPITFLVSPDYRPIKQREFGKYYSKNKLTRLPEVIADLKNLEMLVCGGEKNDPWQIDSLLPLNGLERLKTLILDFNQISEVECLHLFPELEKLSISGNKITQIQKLADNKHLKFLDLSDNKIRWIYELDKFPNLRWLNISYNQIDNMKGLEELWFLYFLDISHNIIEAIRPFEQHIFLKILNISNNKISHLMGLDRLAKLEYLNVSFNKVTSMSGLTSLPCLKYLDLSHNLIQKIPGLGHLGHLELLDVANNRIKILENLQDLQELKLLNAAWNYISQIIETGLPPNLEEVNLNNNKIIRLNVTNHLPQLKRIYAIGNALQEVVVLETHANLKTAVLSNNYITSLSAFAQFKNLSYLKIENNYVESLHGLENLGDLSVLNASQNRLSNIPELETLSALTIADLSGNRIAYIKGLKNLSFLKAINLGENQIIDIGNWDDLPLLKTLNISKNMLQSIKGLEEITALEELDVSQNLLTSLPNLKSLPILKTLKAFQNRITDLKEIENHPSLNKVILYRNEIAYLSDVAILFAIDLVDISYNPITNAKSLINFVSKNKEARFEADDQGLFIHFKKSVVKLNVPYLSIPREIQYRGSESILNWFVAREQGGFINTEAKCILFGNGEVGKTALSHYLRTGRFYKVNDRTHGILIQKWEISLKKCPFYLKVKIQKAHDMYRRNTLEHEVTVPDFCIIYLWDFGGQEYYHATHRLFMSTNALYILLWEKDSNMQNELTGDYPVEYWMENIEHYSPNSITLTVQNKAEDEFNVNNKTILKIQKYLSTDRKSVKQYKIDIDNLKEAIIRQFYDLSYIGIFFPKVYNDIKNVLQSIDKPYISYSEYEDICRRTDTTELGVMEDSSQMETLLKYLDDIGSIICFRFRTEVQAEIMKDYVFINPVWLTNIIYEILEKEKDEFDKEHVNRIVSRYGLSTELWIEVMKQFELIFEIETRNGKRYVAPQYLPAKCKNPQAYDLTMATKKMIHSFTISYPRFLPKSNFLRLIARFGSKSVDYLYWKSGFVFFHNNNTVLAECINTGQERKIKISVQDNDKETAAQIFESIVDIDPNENLEISLDEENYVVVTKVQGKVDGNYLEIDSTTGRTLKTEDFKFLFKTNIPFDPMSYPAPTEKVISLFVSYSSKDLDLQKLLVKGLQDHLSSRSGFRFEFWTDNAIDLGADWNKAITSSLQQSNASILLVSASFASSQYIRREELTEFLRKKKEENYLILPVLVRNFDFASFEQLSGLQFFKTYYRDYGFNKPINRDKLLPFDVLAEDERTTDKQLQDYYKNLADEIYRAVKNRFS